MAERLLRDQRARPAAKQLEQVQADLRGTPVAACGAALVLPVEGECEQAGQRIGQQRPEGLSVQVHPPGAGGRQHAEDQQDQQLRQRALQRARRSRRRPCLGPRHRRLGATADSRRVEGQRVQPRPLGAQAALGVLAGEEPHLVALAGTAVTAERGDMQEDFFPAGLRQDEAEALVVVPAADHARLFHIHSLATRFALHSSHPRRPGEKKRGSRRAFYLVPGPHISPAVLQSIRWNCQVARISSPKAIRYQAKAA